MQLKNILFMILLSMPTGFTWATSGILFLAHGSMSGNSHSMMNKNCEASAPSPWERAILDAQLEIKEKLPYQSEVAFGMWNTHCFNAAISRLEKQLLLQGKNLDHLLVLPLFISSYSAVIEMQKFIFKKRPDRVIPLPNVMPIAYAGKISYLPALDYDPQISMILANRFHHLVHLAKEQGYKRQQMELVLVMHGPVSDKDNIKWLSMGKKYAEDITYLFPVHNAHIVSLRDDAPAEVRDLATKKLREIVQGAAATGKKALILPLLISQGGIEKGILARLENLDYIWSGEMLFPDKKLSDILIGKF